MILTAGTFLRPSNSFLRRTIQFLALAWFWSICAHAQVDASTIIKRSAEANKRDWDAVPQFDNDERDRTKDGDKTYSDTMLYGTPYQRLIAVNGQPLSAAQQKQEQKKYATTAMLSIPSNSTRS